MISRKDGIYAPEGFSIVRLNPPGCGQPKGSPPALRFSDINPEVGFNQVLSRGELVKLALWFLKQAIR